MNIIYKFGKYNIFHQTWKSHVVAMVKAFPRLDKGKTLFRGCNLCNQGVSFTWKWISLLTLKMWNKMADSFVFLANLLYHSAIIYSYCDFIASQGNQPMYLPFDLTCVLQSEILRALLNILQFFNFASHKGAAQVRIGSERILILNIPSALPAYSACLWTSRL